MVVGGAGGGVVGRPGPVTTTRWGAVATGGRRGRRRGTPAATGRRGAASASRSNRRPSWSRSAGTVAVRRAALPLQLLVPRRCLASRGAGEEAARLGLEALALTDHDGFYGVVRFAEAARAVGMPTVFGTELTLATDLDPLGADRRSTRRPRSAQIATGHVARPPRARPARRPPAGARRRPHRLRPPGRAALSLGHLAGEKGAPQFTLADVAAAIAGHVWVLTGCRKGAVPAALVERRPGRRPP